MNRDYFQEVKNGLPLKEVPTDFRTTSVCQMAMGLDPTAIEYVPTKLLTEVSDGDTFVNEAMRRRRAQLECEIKFFSAIYGEDSVDFDQEAYIEECMKPVEEEINRYYENKKESRVR